MPCLMDAMFKFHKFGFKTVVAVVCDGASSNLSMIKLLSGYEAKAYGYVYFMCLQIWQILCAIDLTVAVMVLIDSLSVHGLPVLILGRMFISSFV